jgi:hypothetical protein
MKHIRHVKPIRVKVVKLQHGVRIMPTVRLNLTVIKEWFTCLKSCKENKGEDNRSSLYPHRLLENIHYHSRRKSLNPSPEKVFRGILAGGQGMHPCQSDFELRPNDRQEPPGGLQDP